MDYMIKLINENENKWLPLGQPRSKGRHLLFRGNGMLLFQVFKHIVRLAVRLKRKHPILHEGTKTLLFALEGFVSCFYLTWTDGEIMCCRSSTWWQICGDIFRN
jgi:hypothetical protein